MNDTAGENATRLRSGAIGPWGLAALAIGITSPAMGLYGLWGPMQVATGPITPLVFIAAMFLTLPTAISYALLNQRAPSAGSAATWLWTAASPLAGYAAGLTMFLYFLMATIAQPLLFALFFTDFLGQLGIALPKGPTLLAGVLIATIPIAVASLSGAEKSVRTTITLMLIETAVVVWLSATILAAKTAAVSTIGLSPLNPHFATHGIAGFWAALVLGVLAFCGFDVVSTAAEETSAPREHVPKAIILTIIGMTIFWAANAWVFTLAVPDQDVIRFSSHGLTAITPLAARFWGRGSLIVSLTAFTGISAVYLSCVQGSSRIMFALARRGLMPSPLAGVSTRSGTPRAAVATTLVGATGAAVISLLILRNGMAAFLFWANGLVFFASLTFAAVNLANALFYWRSSRTMLAYCLHRMVPAVGITLNLYLIYGAFIAGLSKGAPAVGFPVAIFCFVLLALLLLLVAVFDRFDPDRLKRGVPFIA